MKKSLLVSLLIFGVLLLDQTLKIWVKSHMEYGDEIQIFGLKWALIHFVENPGMAFGLELGGANGKLLLSVFRLLAVGFLGYFLVQLIKTDAKKGLLISFSFILAGAVGNILDSAFYGLLFSESSFHGGIAELWPPNGGYAPFLHGRVVDMFYFPVLRGTFPNWLPVWGGDYFLFFRPVFNVADMSITIGVIWILLFQRSFFTGKATGTDNEHEAAATPVATTHIDASQTADEDTELEK